MSATGEWFTWAWDCYCGHACHPGKKCPRAGCGCAINRPREAA